MFYLYAEFILIYISDTSLLQKRLINMTYEGMLKEWSLDEKVIINSISSWKLTPITGIPS